MNSEYRDSQVLKVLRIRYPALSGTLVTFVRLRVSQNEWKVMERGCKTLSPGHDIATAIMSSELLGLFGTSQ